MSGWSWVQSPVWLSFLFNNSVSSYLSGICNQLEPFFPEVQASRHHWLVKKTLAGCRKMFPSVTSRKRPITRSELANISQLHSSSSSFDGSLFLAILLTGFHGLMHLVLLVVLFPISFRSLPISFY